MLRAPPEVFARPVIFVDQFRETVGFGLGSLATLGLDAVTGSDPQGIELFRHWLNDFGDFNRFDDPTWSQNMQSHRGLDDTHTRQLLSGTNTIRYGWIGSPCIFC